MSENLGKAVLTLSTDSTKFDKGMDSAKRSAKLKKAFKVGAVAALAVGVAFAKVAKDAINAADNFAKMSKKVGISVESLSGLEFAAKISGTTLDALRTSLTRLAANASDASMGVGEAKEAFDAMKIETLDATGALKPMEVLLLEVADRFALMEDGTEKTALAMDIFGKSGTDLIPMLNAGSAGIQEMKDRARELGIVIDEETAVKSERFNDALVELSSAFQGMIFSILDSGLLDALVDLAEWLAMGSKESTLFTLAGQALTFALAAVQVAVLSTQLAFNLLVLGFLKGFQAINKLMGSWSPFKNLTEGLAAATDQYNEKLTAGAERIDKIWKGTGKLTTEVKKATTATKKHTTSLGKLAKAAKKAADKEKKLVDELADYIKKARQAIDPTASIKKEYDDLNTAGFDLTEIMFLLGDKIDRVTDAFEEMGKEIPDELALLLDLQRDADLASGALTRLISAEDGLAKLSLKKPLEDYNQALKDITTEAATTADQVKEEFDKSNAAITSSSAKFTTELGGNFSTFLGGIDDKIVPGIGKFKTKFDEVMGTVNSFKSTLESIIGLFSEGGAFSGVLSGLGTFADLFGSKEGGGGIGGIFSGLGGGEGGGGGGLTTSFTELAITGVAIQTGIFGTGVSITGVTIQKGEFTTGVSFTGLSLGFGGGGSDKEVAFNTRLTLGWIKDFFPITTQQLATGHGLLSGILTHTGWIIDTLNAVNSDLGSKLDTLIGIQGNRIAPAVESIASRDLIVSVSAPVSVTVIASSGASASEIGTQVAEKTSTQILKVVKKGISTNKLGIRTAIQRI